MEPELRINLRSANSTPSFRGIDDRPESTHSTGSRGRSRRHGLLKLLKSEATVDQPMKDLPAPPILTPGPSELAEESIAASHRHPNISVPARSSSESDLMTQTHETPIADDVERPEQIGPRPTMQSPDVYEEASRIGSAKAVNIDDAVIAIERDTPIVTTPRTPSPDEMTNCTLTGRTHRRLAGRDLPEEVVDVSGHIHGNHNAAMKVRPAIGLIHSDGRHEGHIGTSRIRATSEEATGHEVIHHSGTLDQKDSKPGELYILEDLHHGHSLTPKVRTLFDWDSVQGSGHNVHSNDVHEGHIHAHKVQSYHESSAITFKAAGNSIPRLDVEEQTDQVQEEPSKVTSYWGFLPRFGQKINEDAKTTDEPRDVQNTQANRKAAHSSSSKSKDRSITLSRDGTQPSLSASRYSSASQKSLEAASKAIAKMTAELTSNQENVRHDNERPISFGKPFDSNHPKQRSALQEHEKGANVSTSSVSPTSRQHSVKDDKGQPEQGLLPEKIDPRRAATWLRQLLGYPESSNTNLTQLPEKSHPRHQEHDDYPNYNDNAVSSRVTTFSGQNAADAGAMESAMHHLERLLSEALVLANQVTEQDQDQCGHIDNEELQSYLRNISEEVHGSPNQPSVRESIATHSNEDVRVILTRTPPNMFVGALEGVGHGCSVLPSASAKLQKFAKPNIRSGNIRLHHVSEDSVLPMPPPDKKLKRQRDNPMGVIKPRVKDVPNRREVREYIRIFHQPPITPRQSSRDLRQASQEAEAQPHQSGTSEDLIDFSTQYNYSGGQDTEVPNFKGSPRGHNHNTSTAKAGASQQRAPSKPTHEVRNISLRRRSHVSIKDGQRFSLTRSVKRQPTIARDWSPARKRFVASVACISTALIGVLVGIYAGLVPSIQYYIADFHHYSILGNVGMYLGMALSTFLCWPLPLLHGRKPYILCSLCVAMPLLFPQAIAVSVPRSPYTSVWRWALLLSRAVIGWALGFASMNFHSMLTDLFGASLMSSNPHQEIVDYHDVRRHGGGLGIWLGVWTWCFIGSLGVGFLVGALVIDTLQPSWGLYISIMLIAVVLVLNVLCPEVRRSAWRYSVAEVKMGSAVSRRIARGEIMMHRVKDGPKWWGQEMYHGVALSLEMLRQPGFVVMAVYSAWIYAQVVLIIVVSWLSLPKYLFSAKLYSSWVR